MSYYRLIRGKHHEGGQKLKDGTEVPLVTYNAGDIIESDRPLTELNGDRVEAMKFELVTEEGQPVRAGKKTKRRSKSTPTQTVDEVALGDSLGEMSIKQLRAFAEEEEIDLEGVSKKEDIINTIRQAVSEPAS